MTIRLERLEREYEDPVIVVRVVGEHDIYRFADAMTRAQSDMAHIGFTIQRRQRRRLGAAGHNWMHRFFYGDGGYS